MRFQRSDSLYGTATVAALQRRCVAVVGIGGVGSYAVEALARTGVGRLRIIDSDCVELSNVNRQLWALESTLGRPKVHVAAARVAEINPACECEALAERLTAANVAGMIDEQVDAVVDAIDRLDDKAALLAHCVAAGKPVISCMGAAGRSDPTQVRYGTLGTVSGCPLARTLRRLLRTCDAAGGIAVVHSLERPRNICAGAPLPSCCAVPAAAGLAAAAWVCAHAADWDSATNVI